MTDFVIPLSPVGEPLSKRLYLGLRGAILSGTFPSGSRLPSTRALAEQQGVSRTVVVLAYEQLLAEGFVSGREGSGTYVSPGLTRIQSSASTRPLPVSLSRFGASAAEAGARVRTRGQPALPLDFAYASEIATFPFALWNRMLLRCARQSPVSDLDYGLAGGHRLLRDAICAHLRRSRAVQCDPPG